MGVEYCFQVGRVIFYPRSDDQLFGGFHKFFGKIGELDITVPKVFNDWSYVKFGKKFKFS